MTVKKVLYHRLQIIVTNGTNGIPTTLADMVSRMNHPGGGQTILLQQPDQSDGKDDGSMVKMSENSFFSVADAAAK